MRTDEGCPVRAFVSCESISSFRSRRRSKTRSIKKQDRLHKQRSRMPRRKDMKVLFALSIQTMWGMLHSLAMVTRLKSISNSVC